MVIAFRWNKMKTRIEEGYFREGYVVIQCGREDDHLRDLWLRTWSDHPPRAGSESCLGSARSPFSHNASLLSVLLPIKS